ncbi:S-layer homology domain-containing protein [Bacillus sp. CGMCC 1.16607]|uniref:S-layer homology domain-containing protein n=1 Tax=Bacillus sp. CGMCC 1.16607 TaxID=3351842 RepID=UPI0036271715
MNWKKFNSILVTTALVSSTSLATHAFAEEKQLTDVKVGHPFYKEIKALTDKGIISGYPDGSFKPNDPLKRSQVASLFTRALKLDSTKSDIVLKYKDLKQGTSIYNEIAALMNKGVIDDKQPTYFEPNKPLTRDVMATWLVRAFNLKPNADIAVPLKDLDKIEKEHVENVKILFQNGITSGSSNGKYDPKGSVTRGQFAVFMYRAMYLIDSIDPLQDMTLDLSEVSSIPKTVKVKYKSGEVADLDVKWNTEPNTLSTPGIYELTGTVAGTNKKPSLKVKIEDRPLALQEFKVSGLKQVQLVLNHTRYNEAALKQAANYKFLDQETKIENIHINGKVVTLTFEKPQVNGARTVLFMGKEIFPTDHQIDVNFTDTTAPTIESVESYSRNKLKVTFSEALNLEAKTGEIITNRNFLSAFKLKDQTVKEITALNSGKEVIIECKDNLKDGSYLLEVSNALMDYAAQPIQATAFPFAITYKRTYPTVKKVTDVYPNQFTLQFEQEVNLASISNIEKYFHHTSKSINAEAVYKKSPTEIVVLFNEKDRLTNGTPVFVDANAIKDLWDDSNFSIETVANLAVDQAAPTVQSIVLLPEDKASGSLIELKVAFSEPVDPSTASKLASYKLTNMKNEAIEIKQIRKELKYTNQHYILTLDKRYGAFAKSTYLLQASNIKDLFGNGTDILSYSFETGSEQAPGNFTANLLQENNRVTIAVNFNKKMSTSGQYSILDLAKYELAANGTSYLLDTINKDDSFKVDIHAFDNGKAEIVITKMGANSPKLTTFFNDLQNAIVNKTFNQLGLNVAMVADANGNTTESFTNKITLSSQANFTTTNKAIAVSENEIKITFSDTIENFNPMDFIVFVDQSGDHQFQASEQIYPNDILLSTENGASTITFKLESKDTLSGNAKLNKKKLFITAKSNPETTNLFGQKITLSQQEVIDQIKPTLQKNGSKDKVIVENHTDAKKAIVSLHFNEDIDPNTVTRLSFKVGNGKYEVESAKVTGNIVSLVVKLNSGQVKDLNGEYVEQLSAISDMNNLLVSDIVTKIEN